MLLTAPALVHAQFGGLLKKKAAEALKGKPTPPAPKTGPATVSTSEPKAPTSPLDISESDSTDKANQVMRELFPDPERGGEWDRLPYIGGAVVAAAKALDEPARLAFVEKMGGALKTLVMSDAFAKAHAASIKQQHHAVDHGITGLVSTEELLKRKNWAAVEARDEGESAAATVDNMASQDAESLQRMLAGELGGWTRRADDVERFVNPAHEKKGQVWKACFRAGKPVSVRAMEMAQAWLKEL